MPRTAPITPKLFGGKLPDCLITVRKHGKARGFFHFEAFGATEGSEVRDEIALNAKLFKERTPAQTFSTHFHEMVHSQQCHFGSPSRNGYHNQEWASLMEDVGLTPSDNGEPGGKRTGQKCSHYIVDGGRFDLAFKAHPFAVPYYDRLRDPEAAEKKLKTIYVCPRCDDQAAGKPHLKLHCDNEHKMVAMKPRQLLHAKAA